MAAHMQKYPCLKQYKTTGSYPGSVVCMRDSTSGFIIYIPNAIGNNGDINLFDNVTVARAEVNDFAGGVVIRSTIDPSIVA
jgi:hypothetical protein